MSRASTTRKIEEFEFIVEKLRVMFPNVNFVESNESSWSYKHKRIYYNKNSATAQDDLLHEIGHMKADHHDYSSDTQLLKYESDAWKIAETVAKELDLTIDKKYIEQCMDSYRTWIYSRSLCPVCHQVAIEGIGRTYKCINCSKKWKVGDNQKSRIYKKTSRS